MSKKQIKDIQENSLHVAETLKVLSHPQRLMILCYLVNGKKTVTEIQELCEISQSYTSQLLNRMKREKLIESKKVLNFTYYSIKDKKITKLMNALQNIYC